MFNFAEENYYSGDLNTGLVWYLNGHGCLIEKWFGI